MYANINLSKGSYPLQIEGNGTHCIIIGLASLTLKSLSKNLFDHYQFYSSSLYWEPFENPLDVNKLTMESLVNDLEECRLKLKLNKITIMAHSASGLIALEYALKFPDHVQEIIIIGTPPSWSFNAEKQNIIDNFYKTASPERKAKFEEDQKVFIEMDHTKLSSGEQWIAEYNSRNAMLWFDFTKNHLYMWKNIMINFDVANHFFGKVLKCFNRSQLYSKIRAKIFAALGTHDYVVPPFLWDNIQETIPTLSFFEFKRSGHYPMMEEHELFDKLLLKWHEDNKKIAKISL